MQTCGTVNAIKTLSNTADHLHKHTQLYRSTDNVYHEHLVICVIISTLIAFPNYFTIFMLIIMFILFTLFHTIYLCLI